MVCVRGMGVVLETRQGKALPTDLRTAQTGGFLWKHVWLSSTRWRRSGLLRGQWFVVAEPREIKKPA